MNATLANECHILIVDDEPDLLSLTETALSSHGYQVTVRASSTDALQLLSETKTRCDLLLTDFDMPSVNGLQLVHLARQVRPALPVVLMSGNPDTKLQEEVARLRVNFLPKPWKMEKLILTVQSALQQTSSE